MAWVDQLASWDFQQVIPCHFAAPVTATAQDLLRAFSFLEKEVVNDSPQDTEQSLQEKDLSLLKKIDRALVQRGISPPVPK